MTMARGARKAKSLPYASAFFKQWKSQKKKEKKKKEENNNSNSSTQKQLQNKFHQSAAFCGLLRERVAPGCSQGARAEVRLLRRRRFAGRQSSHKKKYNGNANEPQTDRGTTEKRRSRERRRDRGMEGWRTKLSREETSANWVRWDRLSSCRVEVPHPLLLLVRYVFFFVYVTPTPPVPPPIPPL